MRLIERTPAVIVRSREDWQTRLTRGMVHLAWGLRVEVVLVAAVWTVWLLAEAVLPHLLAVAALLLLAGIAVVAPRLRGRLAGLLYAAHVSRGWERGCRHARLATITDRVPLLVSVRQVPAGDLLRVRMPAGLPVADLEDRAETVAAYLRLREVRVLRDEHNARYAQVTLVRVDPLAGTVALPWPLLAAGRLSLWEPIPVGVDEDGQPVTVSLPERNLLIGGEPGGGKSVAASMPIAVAAFDPDVDLWLLDGKRVELGVWKPCAACFVGSSLADAIDALKRLQTEMDRRYDWLEAHGRRKVEPGDGLRLIVVACDELAYYLTIGDRNGVREFANLLRDLVSRGRAAGIIVVAATQKPSGDIVPTALRDLFGFRWALRCSTRDASDTILGAGWATLGYSAATIAGDQRGVGYLLAEGQVPSRLRSYYLADADLTALAERARLLRSEGEESPPLGVVA